MRNRAYPWLAAVALGAVLLPLGVASGVTPGTPLSCLSWSTRATPASTSSTAWRNVPGIAVTATLAQNFAVQVSATFNGADVRLRMMDSTIGGTFPLAPGSTSLTPRAGIADPFSFTWVGTNPAEHQHTFRLQWRRHSVTPGTVTMKAGDVSLIYQGAPTPTNC